MIEGVRDICSVDTDWSLASESGALEGASNKKKGSKAGGSGDVEGERGRERDQRTLNIGIL